MSVWFPFGFEQSRAAYQAAAQLRQHFPSLRVDVHESRVEISGISKEDEPQILQIAADALITCRQGISCAA